ncbi:MAG: helix-turn-helix domain-containing protein [Stellaceae bacterium]
MRSAFTAEYAAFTRRIVSVRNDTGFTQQQLAEQIGKPQSFVSKYERGERRLDLIEFLAIAEALDIDPCQFIRDLQADTRKKSRP